MTLSTHCQDPRPDDRNSLTACLFRQKNAKKVDHPREKARKAALKEKADRRLSKDDRRRASLDALPARTLHQDMDVLYREEGGYVSRFSQCLLSVLAKL